MLQIAIKIQSISDIITNSSSEVFCSITGQDIKAIKDIIIPLFPNTDSEMGPIAYINEEDSCVVIEIPYGLDGVADFYKEGLEAILDKYLGGHYNIEYEW
jgi:hypothetical protein